MISWVLGILFLLLFFFVLLSPLESLHWWAGKGELEARETFGIPHQDPHGSTPASHYVVYLSGIGSIGGDELSRRESAWLDRLKEELPEIRVVDDVFPYAVDNRGLLQRTTVWLWSRVAKWRRHRAIMLFPFLINLRNIAQVLVSADPRYGPTQSIGLAQEIWRSLRQQGYVPGLGTPVTLIGFSGGGQMALGACWFLGGLGIPLSVITIGGIMSDDPGLDRIEHLWCLRGKRDRLQHLGSVGFPGRWPTAPLSTWGRAKHEGRITMRKIGPMQHDGPRGYFARRTFDEEGDSYADITLAAVAKILRAQLPGAPTIGA